ncbi:MAG: glucokinase [Alphaproteobacteria bacterium]|nr:glucokinase [Alphaproteobacteria bacterium]
MTKAKTVLIADIGGTNARFGIVDHDGMRNVVYLQCSDYVSITDAAKAYLKTADAKPQYGIFSIAGPVEGDTINFTNIPWSFRVSQVKEDLGFEILDVINDFAAVAYSIPGIDSAIVKKVSGDEPRAGRPIGVIGPGTGLGVASLVWAGDRYVAVPGEGGHVTMPATTPREFAIFEQLHVKYHHISAERVCSGKGLENLYNAIRVLDGKLHETEDLGPAEISARALSHSCAICEEALDHMFAFLGRIAGNLALTLNAKGGIYIAGGIPAKLGTYLEQSRFLKEFKTKGRMSELVEHIPIYMATHDTLGLLGLENQARHLLAREPR